MSLSRISSDVLITGNLSAGSMTVPSGAIADAQVKAAAAIDGSKVKHAKQGSTTFGTAIGGTAVASEHIIFVATTTATIHKFQAMLDNATSTGTVSYDLKKNGVTLLSSTVDFTSSDTDRDVKAGNFAGSVALVAGDVLSAAITVSGSPDGDGPFAVVEVEEAQAS